LTLVCLVQHGEAVSEEVDPRRPLSERGRAEVERVASFLARAGFRVSRIVHSTKLRARETAEILARHLGAPLEEAGGLEPRADPKPWAEKLQSTGDLQELAGYLDLGRVTEASLAMLGSREFYVAGLMNPLRRPILLRVDRVEM